MDTIRIARDFGTVSQLLPAGLSLIEAPYTFVNAIRTSLVFISWQENLPAKEVPPKRMWLDGKKLEKWFKALETAREDEMKGRGNTQEGWDGEMVRNAAIADLVPAAVDDDD